MKERTMPEQADALHREPIVTEQGEKKTGRSEGRVKNLARRLPVRPLIENVSSVLSKKEAKETKGLGIRGKITSLVARRTPAPIAERFVRKRAGNETYRTGEEINTDDKRDAADSNPRATAEAHNTAESEGTGSKPERAKAGVEKLVSGDTNEGIRGLSEALSAIEPGPEKEAFEQTLHALVEQMDKDEKDPDKLTEAVKRLQELTAADPRLQPVVSHVLRTAFDEKGINVQIPEPAPVDKDDSRKPPEPAPPTQGDGTGETPPTAAEDGEEPSVDPAPALAEAVKADLKEMEEIVRDVKDKPEKAEEAKGKITELADRVGKRLSDTKDSMGTVSEDMKKDMAAFGERAESEWGVWTLKGIGYSALTLLVLYVWLLKVYTGRAADRR